MSPIWSQAFASLVNRQSVWTLISTGSWSNPARNGEGIFVRILETVDGVSTSEACQRVMVFINVRLGTGGFCDVRA